MSWQETLARYRDDPVAFVREALEVEPDLKKWYDTDDRIRRVFDRRTVITRRSPRPARPTRARSSGRRCSSSG